MEPGRSRWTAVLDAVRITPADDLTTVTAGQVPERLAEATPAARLADLPHATAVLSEPVRFVRPWPGG